MSKCSWKVSFFYQMVNCFQKIPILTVMEIFYYNIYQFLKSGINSLFRGHYQKWGKRKYRPPSEVRKWWSLFVSPTNQEGLDWQSRLWEIKIRFGHCVMVIVVEQMTIMVLVITGWMVLINEYFWDDKNSPRIVDDCLYGWSEEKIN